MASSSSAASSSAAPAYPRTSLPLRRRPGLLALLLVFLCFISFQVVIHVPSARSAASRWLFSAHQGERARPENCPGCGNSQDADSADKTIAYTDQHGRIKLFKVTAREFASSSIWEKPWLPRDSQPVARTRQQGAAEDLLLANGSEATYLSSAETLATKTADPVKLKRQVFRRRRKEHRVQELLQMDNKAELEMRNAAINSLRNFDNKVRGSYNIWRQEFRFINTDSTLRLMKDQIIMAKLYATIALSQKESDVYALLMKCIKESQAAIGDAFIDSELDSSALERAKAMGHVLSSARDVLYSSSEVSRKLRVMLQSTELNIDAVKKQNSFLVQHAAKTVPMPLHCLHMQLTTDYYFREGVTKEHFHDAALKEEENKAKLEDRSLYHYAIFSDNVLAASVVVRSTVTNANEPEKHVFHIVTDGLNFAAMKMWFITHPPQLAIVHVENIDNFKWLNSSYCSVLRQLESARLKEYYFKAHDPSSLSDGNENLKYRNPKYLSMLNHLRFYMPEIHPKLDKILFLDDDIVVQKDLTPLWDVDLKGMVNGAVETCKESFHRFDTYLNFSHPKISENFDPRACGWAFGMNMFDLKEWKKRNITGIYHYWQDLNEDRKLWKLGTLPPGLITFYNLTYPLNRTWHVSGLGYDPAVDIAEIENAAANGNYKPWLNLAISKYRPYWSKYVDLDNSHVQHCYEPFGNGADTDSNADAMQASALPTLPSTKDGRKSLSSAHETEKGVILSSDAEDTKGYEQSQRLPKSPKPKREKERRNRDEHHSSSSKDYHSKNHSRTSTYSKHHSEAHSGYHSRSREKNDDANGSRVSLRDGCSDHDSNDRNGRSGRYTARTQGDERERSSSRVVHDRHGDRHGSREIYRNDRIDRDKADSLEATHRHRERSRSHSRSDLREGSRVRDQSRERERRNGSSRHKDHGRNRDTGKDRYRESDMVDSAHGREKVRNDRDMEWHRVKVSETCRTRGRDKVTDSDKYKDLTRSKYDTSDGYKEMTRSGEKGRDADHRSRRSEETKENSFKEEDEEEYQEKIEQQLAMQEEDNPEKIKEEARRRKEAIMAKYREQQLQKQHLESKQSSNNEEVRAMDRDETTHLKDGNDSSSTGNDEAENKHDSSEVYIGKAEFTVGKSPARYDPSAGAFGDERMIDVSGFGEGSPKNERSGDMFCDDIFGESPAGIRKSGKDDGLHIERNALHDNWDDADGYYTYRFGELLDGRYEITAAHGKGVFSTVVRAKDLKAGTDDPEEVAIKIIRNNETMYKAGKQEVSILEKLASADREDKRHCVRFISSFMYRNHLCLVFESLNMNLREVLKKFGRNIGLKLTAVRAYSKQLFIALKHLKNCKVLHCDIKPDNMLVNEAKNVLKLCDFGNAMLAGMNEVTPYLVSRFYRAPEIILGLPYDHPLDMWSVGCCLYELYTGKVLFPGPSNNAMLRLHMELKGPFPKKMLRKGAFTLQHFDQDLNFHSTEEDPVTKTAVRRLILNIKPKDIGSLISNFPGEDPKMLSSFKDLLDKIFLLDPEKRITVSQALSHPFITGK